MLSHNFVSTVQSTLKFAIKLSKQEDIQAGKV